MIEGKKMSAYVNGKTYDEEPMEDEEEGAAKEGDRERFASLIPMLEEYSDDVEECCDELDPEILEDTALDMGPGDETILEEGMHALDRRLQRELKNCCKGISPEDADYVADHLARENLVADPQRMSGWLFRLGQVMGPADEVVEETEEMVDPSMADVEQGIPV